MQLKIILTIIIIYYTREFSGVIRNTTVNVCTLNHS